LIQITPITSFLIPDFPRTGYLFSARDCKCA
jgi:hypothetical protein